jgi:hypothetical protein
LFSDQGSKKDKEKKMSRTLKRLNMELKVDSPVPLEKRARRLGYELMDLGTDFGISEHLYYIFSAKTGSPPTESLLNIEEVEKILQQPISHKRFSKKPLA